MASAPDPGAAMIAASVAASTSLRETAKWLVAGVTASAVAIFAGSSLTKLGSLDFVTRPGRLSLAIGGLALGFGGLAYIFARAIAVLTVESLSFRTLTEETKPAVAAIRDRMEAAHRGMMPGNAASFADLLVKTDAARDKTDATSKAVMADYAFFRPMVIGPVRLSLRQVEIRRADPGAVDRRPDGGDRLRPLRLGRQPARREAARAQAPAFDN